MKLGWIDFAIILGLIVVTAVTMHFITKESVGGTEVKKSLFKAPKA